MQNHRVHGVSVMPGVVFLDLVMRILAAKGQSCAGFALERILFSEPVVTDEGSDRELRVRITLPGTGAGSVLVDSRVWGSGREFTENMRAVLVADASPALPDLDASALKARMSATLDMEEMYRRARVEQIDHRPPMRCQGRLWKGGGELLAELALEVPAEPGFHLHPAALDATTIAAYGQTELAFSAPFIPVAIDRVRILVPLSSEFYLHAPRTEVLATTGDVISNDYDLYDRAGRHCASFRKLTCKRIRTPDLITRLLAPRTPDDVPVAMPLPAAAASYAEVLKVWIGELLNVPPAQVAEAVGFYELGLGSRDMLSLAARLEQVVGADIYPTLLFEHRDITALETYLLAEHGPMKVAAPFFAASQAAAADETGFAHAAWTADTRANAVAAPSVLGVHGLQQDELTSMRSAARAIGATIIALDGPDALATAAPQPRSVLLFTGPGESCARLAMLASWSRACNKAGHTIDLIVVERAAQPSPLLRGAAAFLRSVRMESPRLAARAVLAPVHGWAQALLAEVSRGVAGLAPTAGVIAVRPDGTTQVHALVPGPVLDAAHGKAPLALRSGSVCVLAGGAGGIGAQLAHWLATEVQARVVVLGRSELNPALARQWAALAGPSSISYQRCDVTDNSGLDAALGEVRGRFGRIDAVFHAAGVLGDELHFDISSAGVQVVAAPKIDGFHALDRATAGDALQLFVVFSSLAAWRPNPGQGAYSFANAMLEALCETRAADPSRSGASVALAWPLWAQGGMHLSESDLAAAMARTGLRPLPSEVAFDCLRAASGVLYGSGTLAVLHGDSGRYQGWLSSAASVPAVMPAAAPAIPSSAPIEIAVVGVSGRYPGAPDIEQFWARLREGYDAIGPVPAERWDHAAIFDAERGVAGRTYGQWGGFLDDIDGFDARMFHMSRREAERADPQERLFLETCWSLFEGAGHPAAALADRNVGVFAGVMWNHYQLCGEAGDVAPAAMHASVANRVSYALDLRGPSMAVDTACSSSLTAISLALDALRSGACSMAIAGGVNLAVHPEKYLQLAQGQFLSDDGRCRSFGAGGSGYVPGEGVGAVLLRPLADALRDGDHVWGVLRGCALNHAGRTSGFTVPSPASQADVMARALRHAAVEPSSISYVEAHGTGTALGDPIEIDGMARVLARASGATLPVGAVKSNIGHLESAAGIAALTKVLLMLRRRELVPSLHSSELNPALKLDALGLRVQQTVAPWEPAAGGAPRRAAISAFGAGGANAHLIVDEYEPAARPPSAPGEHWLLLSAREQDGLRDYAARMAHALTADTSGATADVLGLAATLAKVRRADVVLDDSARSLGLEAAELQLLAQQLGCEGGIDPDQPLGSLKGAHVATLDLADVAYTLQTGRTHLQARLAVKASSLAEAQAALQAFASGLPASGIFDPSAPVSGHPAHAWARGETADFSRLWIGAPVRRVQLPTPRLQHDSFWVGRWQRAAAEPSISAAPAPAVAPLPFENNETMNATSASDAVSLKILGNGVAVVRMQDAGHHNMFTQPVLDGLEAAFATIDADQSVRAVVLTGTDKVFSLGGTPAALERLARKDGSFTEVPFLYQGLAACRVPVVAAIRGHAAGGGLTFGLHADQVVLDRDGTYSANFVKFGFTPGLGATYALERRFGAALASEMCMTASSYAGRELEGMGVALRFADGDQVLQAALKIAEAIAAQAAPVIGALKRELSERVRHDLARVIASEVAMHAEVLSAELVPSIQARARVTAAPVQAPRPVAAVPEAVATVAPVAVAAAPPAARASLAPEIRRVIENTVCGNLFLRRDELDARTTFSEMGLDSLGAVEIVRDLNTAFGLNLDSVLVYDHPTVERLVTHVAAALELNDDFVATVLEPRPAVEAAPPASTAAAPTSAPSPVASASAAMSAKPRAVGAPPLRLKLAPAGRAVAATIAPSTARAPVSVAPRPAAAAPVPAATTLAEPKPEPEPVADEDIAIIGMSARYPGAKDVSELWENLLQGKFSVEEIPAHRWDTGRFYDPDPAAPGKTCSKVAGLVNDVDRFDAAFFGISPREAELMDPQQRVFLEQTWRALEHAGYAVGPERRVDCGVFVGTAAGDYLQLLREAGASDSGQVFLGNSGSVLAGRIAYFLNLKGPTVAIDTACSSSLVAVHLACQSIRGGDCEMAVAGGIALMITPQMHIWNGKSGMLSPRGRCASFDASADGFVLGEGVGTVVVKRLSAALADRDQIHAVIRASGINGDGKTNGITAPSADAQLLLQRRVHARAKASPDDIAYIETHGAGTQLGDPIELKALASLMQGRSPSMPPCGVGSIKSNVGHTTLASGIAGLLKVALSLKHAELPPSLHFDTLNPNIELAGVPLEVVTSRRPWPTGPSGRRMGAVNSFGVSGTNAHFVLEEPPVPPATTSGIVDEAYLLTVSARSAPALRSLLEGLVADLEAGSALADVAHTLGLGRAVFRKRTAIVACDATQAIAQVRAALAANTFEGLLSAHPGADCVGGATTRALSAAELGALGAQFCAAQPGLDLVAFHQARRGRKVVLCGYPLSDTRFWIPSPEDASVGAASAEPIHALLQNAVRELLQPDLDWVSEHQVRGQCWLPGAAILFYGARSQMFQPVELSEVAFLRPARVGTQPVALDIRGAVDESGRYQIELGLAGEPSFARALCLPREAARPLVRKAVETLVADCPQAIEHAALYQAFEQAGIGYGPSYRLIKRVVHSAVTAVAWLVTERARGHIQTFDAVLQVAAALEPRGSLKVPRGIDMVRINRPLESAVNVVAHRTGPGCYDLTACDSDGNAVLEIVGFRLAEIPGGGSGGYQPAWRELSPAGAPEGGARSYTALGADGSALLPRLAAGTELVLDARAVTEDDPTTALQNARELFAGLCRQHQAGAQVTVLTAGGAAVVSTEPLRPLQAALCSMARSAAAERPGLQLQVIDMPHDSQAAAQTAPQRLTGLPGLCAMRAGRWYQRVMAPLAPTAGTPLAGPGAVCLVVGGAGGIGFELSKELARLHGAALGWIGRRPLDSAIEVLMREIEALGGKVHYVAASLAEPAALAQAVGTVRARFGPISAAFHSALVLDDASLETMDAGQLARVLAPKVNGCANLYRCLEGEPIDKLVLFSSVSSLLDSPGQGNYAAASAYLDAWGAEMRRRYGAPVSVVNWGYWGSVGIVSGAHYRQQMAARGVGSIEPADAFERLRMQLGAGLAQSMVMHADPARFPEYGLILAPPQAQAAPSPAPAIVPTARATTDKTKHETKPEDTMATGNRNTGSPISTPAMTQVTGYLQRIFGAILKLDPATLDADETFEAFGVDSLMGMDILRSLKEEMGELPSTLLYEKLTINELAVYLLGTRRDALASLLGGAAVASAPVATAIPASEAATPAVKATGAAVLDYVCAVFAHALKIPAAELDTQTTFETFGVDSLLGMDILRRLKADFAGLPSTLLYERLSIAEVARYLSSEHGPALARLLAAPAAHTPAAAAPAAVAAAPATAPQPETPVPASQPLVAVAPQHAARSQDIAVIASVGRYPEADNLDQFWKNLRSGRRGISEVPAERWDGDAYFDPTPQKNRSYGKWAGFINGVDQFDAKFFGILPSDAAAMDPQERLFLESCWDLLEQSGQNGAEGRETKTGVFVGIMYGSYGQMAAALGWSQGRFDLGHSPYWSVANRVSYVFDFSGPSMAIDTACSSSLTAFHLACESIRRGECRQAIAGGVNVILHPAHHIALSGMRMLGSGLACRTFDQSADGIVPGEGVGAVLLRPLADALAAGDEILAVVRGSMINAGGKTGGYTVPNVNAQAEVIAVALERAGVQPSEVGCIEVHGTGTQLGDPIEVAALNKVYGTTPRRHPLLAGSVKANIGHLEGAAGIAGISKAILQLQHGEIAPCAGLVEVNDKIDFGRAVLPATTLQAWPETAGTGPAICGVSSFGAGGANAHVILQKWHDQRPVPQESGQPLAFLLSANSAPQLAQYAQRLADWLQCHPEANLARLSYTSQAGRRHLPQRAVTIASSLAELEAQLRSIAGGQPAPGVLLAPAAGGTGLNLGGLAEELMALLMARRQLHQLAEMWVGGMAVNWRGLWDAIPGLCSFPSVPLERKRVWMPELAAAPATAELIALAPGAAPVQLDLARLARAHRIGGRQLVPGAAMLALMLDAQGAHMPRALRALRWLRPLVLVQDTLPAVAVSLDADAISLCLDGQPEALAIAQPSTSPPGAPSRDLDGVRTACGPASAGSVLYERLRAGGFEYGREMQGIARFGVGPDIAWAELDLAHAAPEARLAVAIDAAMQLIALLVLDAAVPAAVGVVHQYSAVGEAVFALTEARSGSFDLSLHAADGSLLMRLEGLRLGTLPATTATPQLAAAPARPQYLLAADQSAVRGPALLTRGSVLVSGADNAQRKALQDELARRGLRVLADDGVALTEVPDAVLQLLHPAGTDLALSLSAQLAAMRGLALRLKAVRGNADVRWMSVGDDGDVVATSMAAATKSLAMELPWLACSHVLLAPGEPGYSAQVADELLAAAEQGTVRIASGQRTVRGLAALDAQPNVPLLVRPGAVYLVSGGAGALGRLFTAHLLSRGPATVVLLGRRPADAALASWMASLSVRGANVAYLQVDIGDPDALSEVVAEVCQRFGPVRGVLHAAGVKHDVLLLNKTDREVARVLRPKVRGALALDAATADQPLDFFVLCSSLVAETGNIGQSDYAVGNCFLGEFAVLRERERAAGRRQGSTCAVFWPLWEEGGMQVNSATRELFRQRYDMLPLASKDGLAALDLALSGRHTCFALVQRAGAHPAPASGLVVAQAVAAERDAAPVAALTGLPLRSTIAAELQRIGAGYLMVDPAEVELDSELLELGFDSISLTDMVNQINQHYGLDLLPTVLFECPTLNDVAQYLERQHGAHIGRRLAPAPAPFVPPVPLPLAEVAGSLQDETGPAPVHTRPAAVRNEPIAIIGMAGRLAGAASLHQFWDALDSGASLIGSLPADREALLRDPVTAAIKGGFLHDVARFDAARFGISPREAALMDPQQRLFLETVLQAVEDAGYSQQVLTGRDVGVFAGVSTSDYDGLLTQAGIKVEPHVASGIAHSIISNRVSHVFDWHGPSEVVDTACSSSLVALNRAVRALRTRECDMAIVGGVSVTLSPGLFHAFIESGMLSPDHACKTFDRSADGYVRGEGVGAVLLKPLSRAVADGDHVLAVIRGSAVNHGGKSSSLTAPNPSAQAEVIRRAIADAGIDPQEISFIEAHGTGTRLGDPVEVEGLKQGLQLACADAGVSAPSRAWIALGAVKTVVGHLEAASGMAGLLRTVLSMQHGRLSANRNFKELSPFVRLEGSPFELLAAERSWPAAPGAPCIAGVSSFGFGGTNCHVVLESAPAMAPTPASGAALLFPLSAPDNASLAAYAALLARSLAASDLSLEDIAFTLQHGRDALPCRGLIVTATRSALMAQLQTLADGRPLPAGRFEPLPAATQQQAHAWLAGKEAAWSISAGRRCSLPGLPLSGQRHWFAKPAAAATAPAPQARLDALAVVAPPVAKAPELQAARAVVSLSALAKPALVIAPPAPPPVRPAARMTLPPVTVSAPVATGGTVEAIKTDLAAILLMASENIDVDQRFDELGLDSIFRMDLVRMVNERFGTALMGEDLYNVESVATLAQLVDSTLAGAIQPAPTSAVAPAPAAAPVAVAASPDSSALLICRHVAMLTERQLGVEDNFSNAGLTSFDMLRVIAGLELGFGPLPKSSLFDYTTPRALAAWLDATYGPGAMLRLEQAAPTSQPATAALVTERLPNGAAVVLKRELHLHPDLAETVDRLEAGWAKEGGLPGRDIAPQIFIDSAATGYLNFSERDGLLLAWSAAVAENAYHALVTEWVHWARSRGLRPNLLSMMPLDDLNGIAFCSTSFGTVQRLCDISSFSLEGKDMMRLRKKVNRFARSGTVAVTEYELGSDKVVDQRIVILIDEWSARKEMVNPYVKTVRREIGDGILAARHRVFLTELDGEIVAAIIVTKIPSENGYLLDLEFFGDAMTDGGLDYTIVAIIERLAMEGVSMFSFGATLGVLVADSPNPNEHVERTLGELRAAGLFRGDGNFQFKNKYRTENLPVYLCQPAEASPADVSSVLLLIVNPTIVSAQETQVAELQSPVQSPVSTELPSEIVHAVQPVAGDSPRRAALRQAGWSPLRLPAASGAFELVTDSWAERDDAVMLERVRELTETANAVCLDLADQDTLPFSYVQAAASGRAAELALLRAAGRGKGIIQNNLFQSWTFNQLELDFTPHLLKPLADSADIDLAHLELLLQVHGADIGLCCIELAPNASGGLAMSLENLHALSARMKKAGIPLVFDATRALENAFMLSEASGKPFWEVVAELLGLADALTLSMSKDFGVNTGGLVCSNHAGLTRALQQRVRDRGHEVALAGRRLLACALADRGWVEQAVAERVANVRELARIVGQAGIPVRATGGHAVLVDADKLCKSHAQPVASALAWLYETAGVRAAPHLAAGFAAMDKCIRLTLPVGLPSNALRELEQALQAARDSGAGPAELVRLPGGSEAGGSYTLRDSLPEDIAADLEADLPAQPQQRNWEIVRSWEPGVKRRLLPFEGRQIEVFDSGEGEAVLFLHPFNIGAGFFAPQLRDLAATTRVIVVHAPGVGETTFCADLSFAGLSRMVLAAAQALGVNRFVLAGASFGGLTALALAHAHPERVSGLVLLGSSYKVGNRRGEVNRLAVVAHEDFNALDAAGVVLDRPRAEIEAMLGECESMDPKIGLRYLDVFATRPSLLEAAGQLAVPTLLIHGAHDTVIALDIAAEIRAVMPDARYVQLDDAGHFPSLTSHRRVNALIAEFAVQCTQGATQDSSAGASTAYA